MTPIPRNFAFRGERQYVHGTDMYMDVIKAFGEAGIGPLNDAFSMKILHKATRQMDLYLFGPGATLDKPDGVMVEAITKVDGEPAVAWYVESDRDITERKPYPEDEIRSKCVIDGTRITLHEETGFEPIEVISSMATHINTLNIPPGDKKWVFTRLDISRPLRESDAVDLEIDIVKNMNNVMTKASIVSSGETLGNIFFSLAAM